MTPTNTMTTTTTIQAVTHAVTGTGVPLTSFEQQEETSPQYHRDGEAVEGENGELDILATISLHLSRDRDPSTIETGEAQEQDKKPTKSPGSLTEPGAQMIDSVPSHIKSRSDTKTVRKEKRESPFNAPQKSEISGSKASPSTDTSRTNVSRPGAFARRPSEGSIMDDDDDNEDVTETERITNEDYHGLESDLSMGSGSDYQHDTDALSMPSLNISDAILVSDEPKEIDMIQTCLAACDGGLGWEECQKFCTEDATFSCQCDTLAGLKTLKEYAEFFQLFCQACPGVTWTMHTIQWDRVAHTAVMNSTYHCTHSVSVPGMGPPIPTNKSIHTDYCYIVKTDPARKNKVVHINKVWNDQWALRDLGWLQNPAEPKKKKRSHAVKKFFSRFR